MDEKRKDDLADRAMAAMVDYEQHKERIGDRVTKNMSIDERAAAYARGDSARSPYRNTAKIIDSPRRVRTPSPEISAEEKANIAAQERYRKWRDNIFRQHERSERASSATSERAKRAISKTKDDIDEIKATQKRYNDGVSALE